MALIEFGSREARDEASDAARFFVPIPSAGLSYRPNSIVGKMFKNYARYLGGSLSDEARFFAHQTVHKGIRGSPELSRNLHQRELIRSLFKGKEISPFEAFIKSEGNPILENVLKILEKFGKGPFK